MSFTGEQPERWLIRLLITRDPVTERAPDLWDWAVLLDGGAPAVLSAEIVGYETETDGSPG